PRQNTVVKNGRLIDIIGDSVYFLHANVHYLKRQVTRVSGGDRLDARGVSTGVAGVCCGLYHLLSAGQNLARQSPPAEGGRWCQRPLVPDGRPVAFYPRLSEDQSPANHARLTLWAEPTPEQLLNSSLAARLAPGLSRARHDPGT